MTHPQPDGTQHPEPAAQAPATPPPYTGVTADPGVPPAHHPSAGVPPVAAYQPPTGVPAAAAYQPPAPEYAAPYAQAYAAPEPRLVSPGGRLGAQLLEFLLICVTAGIGWIVWALLILDRGQTPARQLLGHVVADATTGAPLTWGPMFVRELLVKGLLGYIASAVTVGVYSLVDSVMVFGRRNQTLHDRISGSIVVHR
ncbi:hypothetical protein Acy02nite_26760 [Actinoplanes cyaneus]|uniref:RDD domain-containing protein n=1 Tax=Actinoplanes cyaneus TaxID=52696 RepID=A0A919IMM2_9ACTN|nr:RDD family protein [Actinoplanes cyaneus]MCW2137997.1 RDD family protein [Actinoplanes cyaneus]GID64795.1 hypothetical protein Acy02nite_26760 [Actinoplanes cyaneus]